jgi:hypothetical protein
MNQVPQSADLSKLKGILSNAKAVMNKVNENNPNGKLLPSNNTTTTNTTNYISEEQFNNANAVQQQPQRKITKESIYNSKLPDAIKKAMLESPIQQPNTLTHTFNLEDVSDLIEKPKQVNESIVHNNDKIAVSETALRGIIKDVLLEFLTEDYNKKLTENAIKKTINTLLKEGKIKTKR